MAKWKVAIRKPSGDVRTTIAEGETEYEARAYIHDRYTVNILRITKLKEEKDGK